MFQGGLCPLSTLEDGSGLLFLFDCPIPLHEEVPQILGELNCDRLFESELVRGDIISSLQEGIFDVFGCQTKENAFRGLVSASHSLSSHLVGKGSFFFVVFLWGSACLGTELLRSWDAADSCALQSTVQLIK